MKKKKGKAQKKEISIAMLSTENQGITHKPRDMKRKQGRRKQLSKITIFLSSLRNWQSRKNLTKGDENVMLTEEIKGNSVKFQYKG